MRQTSVFQRHRRNQSALSEEGRWHLQSSFVLIQCVDICSIVGFLAGFSLAASIAAYNLLDEYQLASAALQASVEELQLSTEKISSHVRRIEAVEKDLKALGSTSASKDDLSKLRAEVKKIYDGLHVEFLDLRSHVWGMQQDIHSLSKKDTTSVRI
ncbi:hypothetical protein B0H14DRAFT_2923943 [Mycena olivaceomarginata]|nr:hypothetical protein B0H14DRAFT_2923943 [Mycena olivaceomarginata]